MSDEVSQFLEQVERLRGQQIEEDEVRARELEDYLAAKRERQARREERARSISPQKSSPANTPSPRSNRRSVHLSDAVRLGSPAAPSRENSPALVSDVSIASTGIDEDSSIMAYPSSSPTKENEAPSSGDAGQDSKRSSVSTTPGRSGTLSWQQRRPASRGAMGPRPLSMVAAQNATQRSLGGSQESVSATEESFSKEQIAMALGSKDPSWFRQTADSGRASAAFRRNQVEDTDRSDVASGRVQMPGMSAIQPSEPPVSRPIASTPSQGRLGSPIPLHPARFDGPDDDDKSPEPKSGLSTPGRTSPTRSASPTKGMGGFVQSAMMKRSDSIKRWSVTSPPGLARADSVTTNRNSLYDRTLSPPAGSRPQSMSRGGSANPRDSKASSPVLDQGTQDGSFASATSPTKQERDEDASLPSSPSKTMDSRRWSPNKPSWLETALNKPESPKPQSRPASTQPAWMQELNKGKGDRGKNPGPSHRHQVSISGLARSSPMGSAAKPNTTGLGGIYSPPPGGNKPPIGQQTRISVAKTPLQPEPSEAVESPEPQADIKSDAIETVEEPEEPEIMDKVTSPPALKPKPKPETPPKKDFRSNLKSRPPNAEQSKTEEAEFKNVFGNLRKAQTQNYVAPDELKGNILRGKAGLSVTGGPKKTERKDEFKEAILKKKDDFKKAQDDGKGITRSATTAVDKPVPEGLARRAELGRQTTGSSRNLSSSETPSTTATKPVSPKPTPGPKSLSTPPGPKPKSPAIESRGFPGLQKSTTAPMNPQQGRVGGGKLADRFNPSLAGMLARGPPPMASSGGQDTKESTPAGKASVDTTEPAAPGPQLTHMTKGRARGPRRKAPTSAPAPAAAPSPSKTTSPVASPTLTEPKPDEAKSKPLGSWEISSPPPVKDAKPSFSIQQQVASKAALRSGTSPLSQSAAKFETKQPTKPASFSSRKPDEVAARTPANPPSPLKAQKTGDAASQPASPKKLDVKRMSKFLDDEPAKEAKPEPAKEPVRLTHQRTGSRSPVKSFEAAPSSPTKVDSEPVASVKSAASMFGGAAKSPPPLRPKPSIDASSPKISSPRLSSPAQPRTPPPNLDGAKSPPPVDTPNRSPSKQASELSVILTDFFGPKKEHKPCKVDPAEILQNPPVLGAKVKSMSVQMYKISGDGRKSPVAAHNERVLFEREMYICAHEFQPATGRKMVEVYFWVGDEVPESEAADAQLFVSKEARSLGGKLVNLRQGKESSEFVQALGGVIITRRGSSNKYDSLAPNMLCGRRYLGQVAFDEVDFAPLSLCAGFPYLITQSGKCYLWKGCGSGVDELSAAKLIGMDLTLTGELIELEDGSEPGEFWSVFGAGAKKPHSADHWRLKPNYSKYCTRLFCSDADSRQQIYELSPFSQVDLSPSRIYILDAFFETYIIAGSQTHAQYPSFRNALDFAQEYAILAASVEDRPFVPYSTVVLEGAPRDLKSVFRKWDEGRSPTVSRTLADGVGAGAGAGKGGGVRRGRSLRVVPLTSALLALKE